MTKIIGIAQAEEVLDEFYEDLGRIADEIDDAIDDAVRDTALTIEASAKINAPQDTGELRADIATTKRGPRYYTVGSTKEYAAHQEFGTAPHSITPNGFYPLRFFWEKKGTWVSTWQVDHPGHTANPFIRPALNEHRSELTRNIRRAIQRTINREL